MPEFASAQQTFAQIEQDLGAGMVPRIFKILEPQPLLLAHLWGQFGQLYFKVAYLGYLKK